MKKVIISALVFVPMLASAQGLDKLTTIVDSIGEIVDRLLPIVFALILIVFFWGLVKFLFAQGSEEAKGEGKKIMLWGVIALFIAASIWGIVIFIRGNLGIDSTSTITVPKVQQ